MVVESFDPPFADIRDVLDRDREEVTHFRGVLPVEIS